MSSPPNYPPGAGPIPGLEPQAAAPPARRRALGLPAGSVRAILALIVVGLICVLILASPADKPIPIPAYLLYLLFMILGHFFAAHGQTISRPGVDRAAPLYLPSGLIRVLIIAALVTTVAWSLYHSPDDLRNQLKLSVLSIQEQPLLPFIILGGFFLGIILHVLVGRQNTPYWFEDIEAWVALLAVIGLVIDVLITLVINPSLKDRGPLTSYELQGFIATAIAFYCGARS